MGKLEVGQHVAYRRTGVRCGVVLKTDIAGCSGRKLVKIHGSNGAQGWTVSEDHAVRIPGPDEVIVSKGDLNRLRMRDSFLSCLEAAGVDDWDGYDYAVSGEGDDDEDEAD